jgi:hypothetical protein
MIDCVSVEGLMQVRMQKENRVRIMEQERPKQLDTEGTNGQKVTQHR